MGDREIREKYGGKLPKAINRAIRAEVPGGNEALEKLTQLAGAARQSRWKDHAGRETPEAVAYFKHKRDVVDRMDAEVRRRWGVPAEKDESPRRHAGSPRRHGESAERHDGAKKVGGHGRPMPARNGRNGRNVNRAGGPRRPGGHKSPSRPPH
jgi:hypothetical protein